MTAVLTTAGKARARNQWPRCRVTPGCAGRHVTQAQDVARTLQRAPTAQAAPPVRRSKQRGSPVAGLDGLEAA